MRDSPVRHLAGTTAAPRIQRDRNFIERVSAYPGFRRALPVSLAIVCVLLFASAADGQSRFASKFSFGGFGTLGLIHSGERQADFVEDFTRADGPGGSSAVNAGADTRIAGQATFLATSKLKFVLQVMVEQDVEGEYMPHAEWANVSYALTPDFSIRGGRIVMPAFLVAASRKVSFANPWVRPPVELYGMLPVYSLDGVDATWRTRLGEWTGSLNVAAGRTQSEFPIGSVDTDGLWHVNTTFVRGAITGRLALTGATLRMDWMDELFNGFRAFGPQGQAIADQFEIDGSAFRFATAAVEYDRGNWFTLAELGWLETNSAFGDKLAGYVTAGVRQGPVTPYATYSRATLLTENSVDGLTVTSLPPEYAQAAAALNAGLNDLLLGVPVQQTLALGGRWDVATGIALKAQVDFIDRLGGSPGTFINPQPGFEPGGSARLISIATVFVF